MTVAAWVLAQDGRHVNGPGWVATARVSYGFKSKNFRSGRGGDFWALILTTRAFADLGRSPGLDPRALLEFRAGSGARPPLTLPLSPLTLSLARSRRSDVGQYSGQTERVSRERALLQQPPTLIGSPPADVTAELGSPRGGGGGLNLHQVCTDQLDNDETIGKGEGGARDGHAYKYRYWMARVLVAPLPLANRMNRMPGITTNNLRSPILRKLDPFTLSDVAKKKH